MNMRLSLSDKVVKDQTRWTLGCGLELKAVAGNKWGLSQWHLDGFELHPEASADFLMTLELFRDERTDYRFNLSSQQPKLFVVLDILQSLEEPNLVAISASQSLAGQYMDGDYLVLSADMPVAIQAWMEAFIGRNGELLEERRKKRKGAGRSSGQ
ncbi:DUF3305 domain-containing protein [Vibrio ishigakensis]|uniref:DUF3305 domain-containing protein n=1 Tax=Vibrio ishigakensis TaxID=1481914 RepID=UPI0021C2C9B7|nr:DUF3305 domain-containing protein [Vibrio ishigakensis]